MATAEVPSTGETGGVLKSGYLIKQGGNVKNWKKRYFVLQGSLLRYYKDEKSLQPKGTVDLTAARGVRTSTQCNVQWPSRLNSILCFGLATESRTYYLHGNSEEDVREWKEMLQQVIERDGKPSCDWENDLTGQPESTSTKVFKVGAGLVGTGLKVASSQVSNNAAAGFMETVGDVMKDQAEIDTDWKERATAGVESVTKNLKGRDAVKKNKFASAAVKGVRIGAKHAKLRMKK